MIFFPCFHETYHGWTLLQVKFNSYDWQNINDIMSGRKTKIPMFDLETGAQSGFKELTVSEDCGVVHSRFFQLIHSKGGG